ncbi:MAG: hypothetical protein ACXVII_31970 [Solirubrobacteraceae bacterium]
MIAESGGRREDRQKMILEGWRDAILSGHYAGVRYDCAGESVAHWISRLAKNVRLSGPTFLAAVQLGAEEIAALSPAAPEDEQPGDDHQLAGHTRPVRQATRQPTSVRAAVLTEPVSASMRSEIPDAPFRPQRETAQDIEARERRYREIFGPPESKAHRRRRR